MDDAIEIRFHGRGGQGAKTAAQLIVEAAMDEGKQVRAFPEYGPERSGAPMRTFARISKKPIVTNEPIIHPDVVVVIDPTLVSTPDVLEGANKDSVLLVNSHAPAAKIKADIGFGGSVVSLNATKISLGLLGVNKPNTAMLGALVKVTGVVKIESLVSRVRAAFLRKLGEDLTEANINAVMQAYKSA